MLKRMFLAFALNPLLSTPSPSGPALYPIVNLLVSAYSKDPVYPGAVPYVDRDDQTKIFGQYTSIPPSDLDFVKLLPAKYYEEPGYIFIFSIKGSDKYLVIFGNEGNLFTKDEYDELTAVNSRGKHGFELTRPTVDLNILDETDQKLCEVTIEKCAMRLDALLYRVGRMLSFVGKLQTFNTIVIGGKKYTKPAHDIGVSGISKFDLNNGDTIKIFTETRPSILLKVMRDGAESNLETENPTSTSQLFSLMAFHFNQPNQVILHYSDERANTVIDSENVTDELFDVSKIVKIEPVYRETT